MDQTGRDELRHFLAVGVVVAAVAWWGGTTRSVGWPAALLFPGIPTLLCLAILRLRTYTNGGAVGQALLVFFVMGPGPFVLLIAVLVIASPAPA